MSASCVTEGLQAKALGTQEDSASTDSREIQEEIRKYARLIPHVAEPNLGRVREVQEEIKKGVYPSREMTEETAARLALRFLRKE